MNERDERSEQQREPVRVESREEFDETIAELFRTGRPIEAPSLEALASWDVAAIAGRGRPEWEGHETARSAQRGLGRRGERVGACDQASRRKFPHGGHIVAEWNERIAGWISPTGHRLQPRICGPARYPAHIGIRSTA